VRINPLNFLLSNHLKDQIHSNIGMTSYVASGLLLLKVRGIRCCNLTNHSHLKTKKKVRSRSIPSFFLVSSNLHFQRSGVEGGGIDLLNTPIRTKNGKILKHVGPKLSLSLSFSLSHTHTHSHKYTYTKRDREGE
jgi:hypothetical protein